MTYSGSVAGRTQRVDVVVVGAGTAGANAAGQLAARGRSVVLVDRRRCDLAGAQWHNGVLGWQFAAAQVEPPVPAAGEDRRQATHIFGPDGFRAATITDSPVVRADMAALGRTLRERACEAGVELLDSSELSSVDTDNTGRVRAIEVDRRCDVGVGGARRLEADLFVDASGLRGVLRGGSPALLPWCTDVRGDELCSAGDHHLQVTDEDGARRFLEAHGAAPGQSVTVLGPAGGWSTRAVTVSEDLATAAVLVGCIASGPHRTAPHMLARTQEQLPWLGEVISGGVGVIPLRRPYARFTAPGLALVGDSASQVFPAHGSGIGLGLMAGTMLAETVAEAGDCGDAATLWGYQHRFQNEHGGTLAAYDSLRRMATQLGSDGVTRMIHAGLLSGDLTRTGLDQRWQVPSPAEIPKQVLRFARVPSVVRSMVPRLVRAGLLSKVGATYPAELDVPALVRWDEKVTRHLGALPAA